MHDFWKKQQVDKPLFPDLQWSKPEQKSAAGKLLIIGGNLYAFAAPAEAFSEAEKAGAGVVRVVLPDAAKKIVGAILEHVEYAPSTPSGSFSQKALGELMEGARWADAVLVAGDLGRNSETAILLESLAQKYSGQLTLTKDAADYVVSAPDTFVARPDTLLVLSFAQLQKLATKVDFDKAFTFDMNILKFVDTLHDFSQAISAHILVKHHDQIFCVANGQLVSTKLAEDRDIWRVKTAAHAAVWWLQNPSRTLEAISTGIFEGLKKT